MIMQNNDQELLFEHQDSFTKAEELLLKAHQALNENSELFENNDAKLKEIDKLISDLEKFNVSRCLDALERSKRSTPKSIQSKT